MATTRAAKTTAAGRKSNESGIALFMVLASISVLAILVTELVYTAQMNQKLAYDGLDQVKALYLAKSGFKLSLLRLKAYQIVKDQISNMTGGSTGAAPAAGGAAKQPAVPQSLLNKIWSFPFMYPIPTSIPGLSVGDKDAIEKFQKGSGLEGSFTALIESESSRYNLNMILPGFQPLAEPSGAPSSSPSGAPSPAPPNPTPSTGPSSSPSGTPYDADESRKSLQDYLATILQNKITEDPDSESDFRDFKIDEFMDALTGWADPTYERKNAGMQDIYPSKHGPFYSVSELHMLPMIDDELYDLFSPGLTAQRTAGINVNFIQEATLRAIVPNMTVDEVKEFFKFRDDPEQDNTFSTPDDFFTYLKNSVGVYKTDQAITTLKSDLQKRSIRLITDETTFKITVVATVNQSIKKIEAWVTLLPSSKSSPPTTGTNGSKTPAPAPTPSQTPDSGDENAAVPDPGIRITFMRVS